MNDFSLSHPAAKVLPEIVISDDGNKYEIDADFRTVLRCMRVCDDPDLDPHDALYLIVMWFFRGVYTPDAASLFFRFIHSGSGECDGEEAKMDFEQDADAIYASFMMDYGIDLIDIPFLHWYKFRALLSGLSEKTPLRGRIRLRELDTAKLIGKDKLDAERAKRRVQLIQRMSAEEEMLCRELQKALAEGRDPAAVLEKLKSR